MNEKILVVDDDPEILKLIEFTLIRENFLVRTVDRGLNVIKKIRQDRPELIILDLVMPDVDGLEICRMLRNRKDWFLIPIIIITGKDKPDDIVNGLEAGADDYVVKPFGVRELVARVKAILRRVKCYDDSGEVLMRGGIRLDTTYTTACLKNSEIIVHLTQKEFDLLYTLMRESPKVLKRSRLLKSIWGYEKCVESRTLDVHIKRLRKKLGPEGAIRIKTISGEGYKFV